MQEQTATIKHHFAPFQAPMQATASSMACASPHPHSQRVLHHSPANRAHPWAPSTGCCTCRPTAAVLHLQRPPQLVTQRVRLHAVRDGDTYSSNLGVLQPMVESVGPGDDPYVMQRVSVDSFASRGFYLDGTALFGSSVLLLVLLALTFERILGLDRVVNAALQRWKESRQYERRNEVIKARQALEESWDGDDESS